MEMGDGDGMGGWVAALSLHCGRMLVTRQSLFADQFVACITIMPPPAYQTLMNMFSMMFEISGAVAGFVCLDRCPAAVL